MLWINGKGIIIFNSRYYYMLMKAVDIKAAEKGVIVTIKTAKGKKSIALKGNVRQSARQTKNIVSKYRPDLVAHALARVSRIIASQQPAKALRAKKLRGKKALAASA
jgi:hypothetical protein